MIFVTVGTHEQPFDRLIQEVDRLKERQIIKEHVIIQTGFSNYSPQNCSYEKWIPYLEMNRYIQEARIVITHGGPASFLAVLQMGKIPIVVPRQKRYEEHINDHQLEFCRIVEKRLGYIILIEEMEHLEKAITEYEEIVRSMHFNAKSNNSIFCENLKKILDGLMADI